MWCGIQDDIAYLEQPFAPFACFYARPSNMSLQPTRYGRHVQGRLAVVSSFALWRALPVTARGGCTCR